MLDKEVRISSTEPEIFGHPKGLFYLFLLSYGNVLVSME